MRCLPTLKHTLVVLDCRDTRVWHIDKKIAVIGGTWDFSKSHMAQYPNPIIGLAARNNGLDLNAARTESMNDLNEIGNDAATK